MPLAPEAFYRLRLAELVGRGEVLRRRRLWFLGGVVGALVLGAVGLWVGWVWAGGAVGLGGVAVLVAYLRVRREEERVGRLVGFYERGLGRVLGKPVGKAETGEGFRVDGHIYDRDLNVLGEHSLFARLATMRTGLGQRALAGALLRMPELEESQKRQAAVQELAPLTGLREEIALLGVSAFQPVAPEVLDDWLEQPAVGFPGLLRVVLYGTSAVAIGLGVLWLRNWIPDASLWPNLGAVLGVQAVIALRYRPKASPILEGTARLPGQIQILRDGIALLRAQKFVSERLLGLQRSVDGADSALEGLQRSLFLVEQRKTGWFIVPSLALNVGTHVAIRINEWKASLAGDLRGWMEAFGEFDALAALGCYAFERPEDVYPELLPSGSFARFEAIGLTHALLPGAVANDVSFSEERRFYLISGSNMAGKSTLLRAIGLAVVLGRAGCPVPARSLRMTEVGLGASLALTDSLAEGKSKFLAEVERLREILAAARAGSTMFLIDELFSGTNSSDRLAAGRAVLDALLAAGAIGALSTHDLALTGLADEGRGGVNVHMASADPDDPLGFDYLLKAGVNTSTNALAFLRFLDIDARPDVEKTR